MTSLTTEFNAGGLSLFNKDEELIGKIVYTFVENVGRYHVIFEEPYSGFDLSQAWCTCEAAEFYALAVVAHVHKHLDMEMD